jgi:hypothetical protein
MKQAILAPHVGPRPMTGYWLTPPPILESLTSTYGKLYDPTPYPCPFEFDGLEEQWPLDKVVYCNPPFAGARKWSRKALQEAERGVKVLFIISIRWDRIVSDMLHAGADYKLLEVAWRDARGKTRSKGNWSICILFGLNVKVEAQATPEPSSASSDAAASEESR